MMRLSVNELETVFDFVPATDLVRSASFVFRVWKQQVDEVLACRWMLKMTGQAIVFPRNRTSIGQPVLGCDQGMPWVDRDADGSV